MRFIIIISLLLFSCHEGKLILRTWDTYTIKSGHHYSGLHALRFSENTLMFEAIFDSTAIYTTPLPKDQGDINKLFGFSDCGSMSDHKNSARFGWNWKKNKLNIYAYCYSDGKRQSKFITSINLNQSYHYVLYKQDYKYIFEVDGKSVEMDRCCKDGNGELLFPYFGGNSVIEHDVTIKLKYLS